MPKLTDLRKILHPEEERRDLETVCKSFWDSFIDCQCIDCTFNNAAKFITAFVIFLTVALIINTITVSTSSRPKLDIRTLNTSASFNLSSFGNLNKNYTLRTGKLKLKPQIQFLNRPLDDRPISRSINKRIKARSTDDRSIDGKSISSKQVNSLQIDGKQINEKQINGKQFNDRLMASPQSIQIHTNMSQLNDRLERSLKEDLKKFERIKKLIERKNGQPNSGRFGQEPTNAKQPKVNRPLFLKNSSPRFLKDSSPSADQSTIRETTRANHKSRKIKQAPSR